MVFSNDNLDWIPVLPSSRVDIHDVILAEGSTSSELSFAGIVHRVGLGITLRYVDFHISAH